VRVGMENFFASVIPYLFWIVHSWFPDVSVFAFYDGQLSSHKQIY